MKVTTDTNDKLRKQILHHKNKPSSRSTGKSFTEHEEQKINSQPGSPAVTGRNRILNRSHRQLELHMDTHILTQRQEVTLGTKQNKNSNSWS